MSLVLYYSTTLQVIPTTFSTTSIQKEEPHSKPNDGGGLQVLPADTQSVAAIKNCVEKEAFQACQKPTTYNSLGCVSGEADTIGQRGTSPTCVVSGPHRRASHHAISPLIPDSVINNHTTSSVGTALHGPMTSFCEEKALPLVHLPIHLTTFSTNRVKNSVGRTALDNETFCSVTTPSCKVVTVSSSGYASKSVAANTVPLLSHGLNEIVPNTEMRDQLNKISGHKVPKGSVNFDEPLLCSDTGIHSVTTNMSAQNGSKRVSSLLEQKILTDVLNICNESTPQENVKRLLDQHSAEYLSPLKPVKDELKAESKKWEVSSFEFPFVLDRSISNSGQSVGLVDRVTMPAQATGLGNTTSSQNFCPMKSTSICTPSPRRIASSNDIDVQRPDISQKSVKDDTVTKDNKALYKTPDKLEVSGSKFQPDVLPRSAVSVTKPHSYKPAHRQNVFNTKPEKGDCTTMILSPINKHQDASVVENKTSDTAMLLPPYKNVIIAAPPRNEGLLPLSEKNASGQVTESFSNHNLALSTGIYPNKVQAMLSSTKQDNVHNLLSSVRFYNDRECEEHTRRPSQSSTSIPYHVPAKPRYLPYPAIRTKPVQQVPLMGSNVRFVPKVTERQTQKPHCNTQSLNGKIQFASKQCSLLPKGQQIETTKSNSKKLLSEPARLSCSPETSSSKVKFTNNCAVKTKTSPSYNKERLLLELLQSNRTPFIPQHVSRTCSNGSSSVKQDLSSAQSTNAVTLSSQNSETSKRYVHLQPGNPAQDSMSKPKIPSVFDSAKAQTESADLPGKPSSAGKSDKESSWQTKCTIRPQIELSTSCQQYFNQLKKSPEVPTLRHQNSIYSIAKLTPHSERGTINLNESFYGFQFPFPSSSMKRQTTRQQVESGIDQPINRKTLTTQNKKENDSHKQHQKPLRLLYHHKKFINPQQQQEEQLGEKKSGSHIINTSVTKQHPQEVKAEQNAESELIDRRHSCSELQTHESSPSS